MGENGEPDSGHEGEEITTDLLIAYTVVRMAWLFSQP